MACVLAAQAEQVIEEDNMLGALDIIEHYCTILTQQATQLDNPKYVQGVRSFPYFDSLFPLFSPSHTEKFQLRWNPGNAVRRSRRQRRG